MNIDLKKLYVAYLKFGLANTTLIANILYIDKNYYWCFNKFKIENYWLGKKNKWKDIYHITYSMYK